LGLGSLLASELIPISKFGMYAAWGVVATLALLFLYLPACLHFFPSRDYLAGGRHDRGDDLHPSAITRFWQRAGGLVVRHNLLVAGGCVAVMGLFVVGLGRMEYSVKLMKLFSPDAEIINHYGWLEDHLGPLVPMEVVIKVDNAKNAAGKRPVSFLERMRLTQRVEAAVEGLDEVGGALSAPGASRGLKGASVSIRASSGMSNSTRACGCTGPISAST
jgi:uncharacterized membrane protein YdfJ with MMPL/SSD domain